MANVPCIVSITVLVVAVRHFFIIEVPGSVLALRHILRLASRGHSTDRLLKLLDILQLVICFTTLPVLLLELIFLVVFLLFLRDPLAIWVRVVVSAALIVDLLVLSIADLVLAKSLLELRLLVGFLHD